MIDPVEPTPLPPLARKFSGVLSPLYRFFDWLYSSRYNPLYRSGTLAVGFLFVLVATGLYLSFFYSVSTPYASVAYLDEQAALGRWIRALHRYSSAACLIAVVFHVLQLLAQGKTWGPRFLAWVSGVVLTGILFIAAWTGYVMVWDAHGQLVALAGARLLSIVPVLGELFNRSFSGAAELPPGFFFMNLFLHVALPLGMVFGLWVHTSRLSRAVWLPENRIFAACLAVLLAASIVAPAPLLDEANLRRVVGRIPIDISTGFWIPWLDLIGVWLTRGLLCLMTLSVLVIPWWWRPPRRTERPVSKVDLELCSGCTQCARDCPYEAITMVPRPDGKRLVASVSGSHCVSCGICAASCADFAIGPPGRSAHDQHERVLRICRDDLTTQPHLELTIIACANNYELSEYLEGVCTESSGSVFYPVECCGCVHSDVLERLLEHSEGVALLGCPARNCLNRDGGELLSQRIFEKRVPFVDRSIDRKRLLVGAFSGAERNDLAHILSNFREQLTRHEPAAPAPGASFGRAARMILSTALIAAGILAISKWPMGRDISTGLLRISGLLPSFAAERCHPPTEADIASIPIHMRPKEICERIPLRYGIGASVDGKDVLVQEIGGPDNRVDKPLYLNLEAPVEHGKHQLQVRLTSFERDVPSEPLVLRLTVDLKPGEIFLVQYNREKNVLEAIP